MTSDELYDAFRSDVVDLTKPYLWSDSEVWRYMADAYRMFVRLTGGIRDFTSDLCSVPVVTGEGTAEVSKLILKFLEARLDSTGRKLILINYTDIPIPIEGDYSTVRSFYRDDTPGEVTHMVVGQQNGIVSWRQPPATDDTVSLTVDRLPLDTITGRGQEFDEVDEQHHEHLLIWMKARAYGKQDAETFDKGRRDDYKQEFFNYCSVAKAELERYRSKVRVVNYGGL